MVIGGGLCSSNGAAAFNGSYVEPVVSGAFGQQLKSATGGYRTVLLLPAAVRTKGA